MGWRLSRFRAGDVVEVRTKEEILATLDGDGTLDGMPFMPEMLQYCGQRFEVDAVAHKTCDTARKTYRNRRLDATVHVGGLRCDGSAHGGCEAQCTVFWKDAWLKPAGVGESRSAPVAIQVRSKNCAEQTLFDRTRRQTSDDDGEPRYSCQATKLFEATKPLNWWDPRQYMRDITTGNHSIGDVLSALWLAALRRWQHSVPRGYRTVGFIRSVNHRWLVGGEVPDVQGKVASDQPTPTGTLNLQPGEQIRIKSKREIQDTLRTDSDRNRGLSFDQEMVPYCGSVRTVRSRVNQLINEATGQMTRVNHPCIILEGVVCTAQFSGNRLMCPRQLSPYWREIWLERIDARGSETNAET